MNINVLIFWSVRSAFNCVRGLRNFEMDFTESTKVVYNRIQKLEPENVSKIIGTCTGPRTNRRSPSLPDFPVKVCHYFNKGFCKHGNNCRYFHGNPMPESFSQIFSPKSNEISNEEHFISSGSLEKLEMELTELLLSRRGMPVSIASLPMIPHGQHSVILAEDVPKYLEYAGEEMTLVELLLVLGRSILPFQLKVPLQSKMFQLLQVSILDKFGPVQDVRIPCQQKRMFVDLSLLFSWRLSSKYWQRGILISKYSEKIHHPMYYSPHFIDGDSDLYSTTAEQAEFPSAQRINHFLDVLNNGSSSEDKLRRINSNYSDQDSQGLDLPESPFASMGSGISTVI
ncbi:hypothetical protein GH714_030699 [Hevea brasiliensis]|uniref:C3H1-type domain-containing protein n=1 Tax=Hevea brasiliensis TaxID=3981 RepID=A0A6A6K7U3_HEVBR|nr:hypothetical protein GH714_030699 [Hevea brasiliensis]